MRIKFEKGFTPETIAEMFVGVLKEMDADIGAVNIYIQTYDENGKAEPFEGERHIVVSPGDRIKADYESRKVLNRRSRFKVVGGDDT